jgi:hypothetical protein
LARLQCFQYRHYFFGADEPFAESADAI